MLLWTTMVFVVFVVGVPVLALLVSYNGLVTRRNSARQALSGISVQLRRRADLIPNLVGVVKGYAAHESAVFKRVTELRAEFLAAADGDVAALQRAAADMRNALGRIVAVAEGYPELRASANYRKLQEELAETEDQIAAARRIYNANVATYNTATEQFPSVVVARWFEFEPLAFFADDAATHGVPAVAGV